MDLYYNDQKIFVLPTNPLTTIGDIKKMLQDWLAPQGVINYEIKLYFNNGTQIAPVVFQTNQYDNINFLAQTTLLQGSKLYVINNPTIETMPTDISKLPNDVLVLTALNLNYNEIMNLCNTSKKINMVVCNNKHFWIRKILQDFKIDPVNILGDPRKYYKNLIKPKYYILVDTDYEDLETIYKDITNQLPIVEVSGTKRKIIVEDLVSLGGKPTKPQYNETVNKLYNIVRKNNLRKGRVVSVDGNVYNPIFLTYDIKKKTIKNIINLARDMDYCEIWGDDNNISEYKVEPGIILVHLNLKNTELG